MLTDPLTSPNRYPDQAAYGLISGVGAVAATLLGAGQLYLLVATVGANLWLAGRRLWQRRPAADRASRLEVGRAIAPSERQPAARG
jgi:hypothetical protein